MKRILIGIIAVIMGLSMVACNKNEEKGSNAN